jgi:hypothetical protein
VPVQNERSGHHAFLDLIHLMTPSGGLLNAMLRLTLGNGTLERTWHDKGNPAISDNHDAPAALHSFCSMSGVMFIDD